MQKRGAEHVRIDATQQGRRLDNFVSSRLPSLPKSRIYQMIRKGEVRVNGGRARPDQRLEEDDDVRLPPVAHIAPRPEGERAIPRHVIEQMHGAVLHEEPGLYVVNKPAGLPVHSGSGQAFGVIDVMRALHPDDADLQLAHRLDRDTSGCLVIARDHATLRMLHDQFRDGAIRKRYTALLRGNLREKEVRVDVALDREARRHGERTVRTDPEGQSSFSHFRVLRQLPGATLVDVSIATGRTHQIRVHAQHMGHPVAGDDRYGSREFNRRLRRLGLKRVFLHARKLQIPRRGQRDIAVEAPMPAELDQVIARLTGTG